MKKQLKRFGAVLLAFAMAFTSLFMSMPQNVFATVGMKLNRIVTTTTIDDFEDYGDKNAGDIWKQDNYGDSIEMSTTTGQSSSTALAYKYWIGGKGYTGTIHSGLKLDLSQYKGISLWLKQDGSGNSFAVQFKSGDDVWEAKVDSMSHTSGVIEFPFDQFYCPSWRGGNSGKAGASTITQIVFFINGSGSGTVYIDDIKAYGGPEVDEPDIPDEPSEPSIEVSVPSQKGSEPTTEVSVPSQESSAPTTEVSEPSNEVSEASVPSEEVSVPSQEVSVPSQEVSVPSEEVSVPSQEVSVPSEEVSVPSQEVSVPSEEVSVPSEEVSVPSQEVSVPSQEASVPSQEASVPSEEVSVPSEEVSVPSQEVSVPSQEVSVPSIDIGEPSNEVSVPLVDDGKDIVIDAGTSADGWSGYTGDGYFGTPKVSYDSLNKAIKADVTFSDSENATAIVRKEFGQPVSLGAKKYIGYKLTYPAELEGKISARITGKKSDTLVQESAPTPEIEEPTNLAESSEETNIAPGLLAELKDRWIQGNNDVQEDTWKELTMKIADNGTILLSPCSAKDIDNQMQSIFIHNEQRVDWSSHKTLDFIVRNTNSTADMQLFCVIKGGETTYNDGTTGPKWTEPKRQGTQKVWCDVAHNQTTHIRWDLTTSDVINDISDFAIRIKKSVSAAADGNLEILAMEFDESDDWYAEETAELNRPKSVTRYDWTDPNGKEGIDNIKQENGVLTFDYTLQQGERECAATINAQTNPGGAAGVGEDWSGYGSVSCTLKNKGTSPVNISFVLKTSSGWDRNLNNGTTKGKTDPKTVMTLEPGASANMVYNLKESSWQNQVSGYTPTLKLQNAELIKALTWKVYSDTVSSGTIEVSNFQVNFSTEGPNKELPKETLLFDKEARFIGKTKNTDGSYSTWVCADISDISADARNQITTLNLYLTGQKAAFSDSVYINDVTLFSKEPGNASGGILTPPSPSTSEPGNEPDTPSDDNKPSETSKPSIPTQPSTPSNPSSAEPEEEIKLTLKPDVLTLPVGEKRVVEVLANEKNVTKEATFTPAGTAVVKMGTDNVIEGIAEGITHITIEYKGAVTKLKVIVQNDGGSDPKPTEPTDPKPSEVVMTGIHLVPEVMTVVEGGKSRKIGILAVMSDGSERLVNSSDATYKANNSSAISVDEQGNVKGLKAGGNTFVTVTYNGYTETCVVEVISNNSVETELTLSTETLEIKAGESAKVTASATPNTLIEWLPGSSDITVKPSADEKTADIEVSATAISSEVYVLVMAGNAEKTLKIKVTQSVVEPSTEPADKITLGLNKTSVNLALNQKTTVTASVDSDSKSVTAKDIVLKTTSISIVTAKNSNGKITLTAKGAGIAYITVSVKGAASQKIKVTIKPAKVTNFKASSVKAKSFKLSWKKQSGVVGYQLKYDGKTRTTKQNSYTITGLKPKKKYKVKIRTYRKTKYGTVYGTSVSINVTTKRK